MAATAGLQQSCGARRGCRQRVMVCQVVGTVLWQQCWCMAGREAAGGCGLGPCGVPGCLSELDLRKLPLLPWAKPPSARTAAAAGVQGVSSSSRQCTRLLSRSTTGSSRHSKEELLLLPLLRGTPKQALQSQPPQQEQQQLLLVVMLVVVLMMVLHVERAGSWCAWL